jgi:hypothetical protein
MPVDLDATKATTLFSLETFKTWLKTQGVDTSDDMRLVVAADGATAEIERLTGVYFVKRSVSETFSGDGKIGHALKYAPVISIDAFTIDGVTVVGTPYIVASPPASSDYYVDGETGIITFTGATTEYPFSNGGFGCGIKNIVIGYTAGFDQQDGANLPGDVYRAGLDLAKAIYDELAANAIAATTVSLGPSSMVIKAATRPPSVQRVIDSWAASGYRL